MAGKEQEHSSGEKTGETVRNWGLVIALLGLLTMIEAAVGLGAGLATSGEIFRRNANKRKKK